MSGYYGPPPNSNVINNGEYPGQQQQQQHPQYTYNNAGVPMSQGHTPQLPQPTGYFGNGMYPSQIPPGGVAYAQHAYAQQQQQQQQQQAYPTSTPMSPSSDSGSKRPLPTPRTRPASAIYPPGMPGMPPVSSFAVHPIHSTAVGAIPVHQRSMTFDPAAYNAAAFQQSHGIPPMPMQGMPIQQIHHHPMQAMQQFPPLHGGYAQVPPQVPPPRVGGARPASMQFPPGWNPYPLSPIGGPTGSPIGTPTGPPTGPSVSSSFAGSGNRRVSGTKKDADLPPLPPGNNPSPPMTPGSGAAGAGKRALPSAPGGNVVPTGPNGVNRMGINMSNIPSWNTHRNGQASPSASSPPDKRPLPMPSPSLPRISTTPPTREGVPTTPSPSNTPLPGNDAQPPAGGASSPTKRALPSAPGSGGIQPGTTPLPTSPPTSIPNLSRIGTSPPTSSSPSRSNQSNPTPPTPAGTSATPPPTSAPSSYASARSVFSTTNTSNGPSAPSSFTTAPATRPSSYSSPSPPPTGAPRSTASDTGAYSSQGEDKRPLWRRMAAQAQQAGQVASRPQSVFGYHHQKVGGVGTHTEGGGGSESASVGNSASGKGKIPEGQAKNSEETPKAVVNQSEKADRKSFPAPAPVPASTIALVSTPAARHAPLPNPPGRTPSPATAQARVQTPNKPTSAQDQPREQAAPAPSKAPIAVQPTLILPYQPKTKPSKKQKQEVQPPTQQPQQSTPTSPADTIPSGGGSGDIGSNGGKVRFSQEAAHAQSQPISEARASRSPPRVVATSPPRASAMKKGAKSPPKAEAAGFTSYQHPPPSQPQAHARPSHHQRQYSQPLAQPHEPAPPTKPKSSPPPKTAAVPQISMALRFASMDLQDEARATDKDWAKWALVSSHDVATKPVPLSGSVPPPPRAGTSHEKDRERVRRKDSGRRRSASTGAQVVSLEDPPPPPVVVVTGRRGSFDETSAAAMETARVDTASMIQAAAVNGGMRRGGARPMPSAGSRPGSTASGSSVHGRVPSEEAPYPQYRPSYTDSEDGGEDGEGGSGPSITVSAPPPQISISSPADIPSINIEGEPEMDFPGINITIDEPESSPSNTGVTAPINAASVPIFSFAGLDEDADETGGGDAKGGKKKKHKKEKSVKEEEDERERARQRAKTRPLPPKINKNSGARCGKCDKIIMGRIVSAMNARWHPECFRCSVCETFLEHVSSYEHDDRPYCHLDYHELFAPKCFHCKTPIMEEHFITLDDEVLGKRTYHEQHFFCAECGDPFLTPKQERKTRQLDNGMLEVLDQDDEVGFTVYKGHPYCEACHVRLRMPKCKRCKKSIRPGDQAIEALGGKWCWECFTCNRCSKPFDDPQFYEHDQKPFCQPCYSILLVNQLG